MPHYFIDTDDGDRHVRDHDGLDFPDDETARLAAQEALPDMAREKMPDGDRRVFSSSVRTSHEGVIYSATLSLSGKWIKKLATP